MRRSKLVFAALLFLPLIVPATAYSNVSCVEVAGGISCSDGTFYPRSGDGNHYGNDRSFYSGAGGNHYGTDGSFVPGNNHRQHDNSNQYGNEYRRGNQYGGGRYDGSRDDW